ncbi:MAG TPA: Sec-independent protein translocase subunit TatA [Gammaproteobacteria bacterium]|nr:Sec-independent protein translocase subunit TatA [Gammaproteobacteria bacterium]
MGFGSIWHWLIVLAIVVLIFGTKKLKSAAGDIGGAVKDFKKAMSDDDKPSEEAQKRLESDEQDAEFPEQKKKNKNRSA